MLDPNSCRFRRVLTRDGFIEMWLGECGTRDGWAWDLYWGELPKPEIAHHGENAPAKGWAPTKEPAKECLERVAGILVSTLEVKKHAVP